MRASSSRPGSWARLSGAVHPDDRLDADTALAEPVVDLGGGDRAEALGPAGPSRAVVVEVGEVEVQVERRLGFSVCAGGVEEVASAWALRTPRGWSSPAFPAATASAQICW